MPPDRVDVVVRYGPHAEQIADVRLPPDLEPSALVLLIHGGFWREEYDRHHTDPLAADLAERGYAVASIEYRRVGGAGGWPYTFDDIAAAMDRVSVLVSAAGARPVHHRPDVSPGLVMTAHHLPVVVLGHSAGAHLALWAAGRHRLRATSPWHLPQPPGLAGVVALAPVADLAYACELDLDDGAAAELLGGRGPQWASRLEQADPCALPPTAPVVIVHGDRDRHVPLELARRYAESVRSRGADVVLDVVADTEHFALIDPTSIAWQHVLDALARVAVSR